LSLTLRNETAHTQTPHVRNLKLRNFRVAEFKKPRGGVELWLYSFLTSALEGVGG
jgi:hypothetical protein